MTKSFPSYLRVHTGPVNSKTKSEKRASSDAVTQFWSSFSDATGWRIDSSRRSKANEVTLLPAVNAATTSDPGEESPTITKSSALRLAKSASKLAAQLTRSHQSMRIQEMELAARAAIVPDVNDRAKLADKIERILAEATEGTGCAAAALYLLDDDTELLKARSVFGLPLSRLEDAPRELRGSRGDLEAMVQTVVTIDNFLAGGIDTWNSPEPYAAGICVSVNDGDVPIGTLWLFADEVMPFGKRDEAVARMAASFIASELKHAAASPHPKQPSLQHETIRDVAEWQHLSLPIGTEIASGWRADGMIESPRSWASGWHTWDVLPDGTIMLAMAEADDNSMRGAIAAVVARTAITAHAYYRHDASQMLSRINDTLWQTNSGDQLLSMLYMHLDPESGEGNYASSGNIMAMICSQYGYRPLVDGASDPLGTHINARAKTGSFSLLPGEAMLAYNKGMQIGRASQAFLGDRLRKCLQASDRNPLAAIRREMAGMSLDQERAAVTLLRS